MVQGAVAKAAAFSLIGLDAAGSVNGIYWDIATLGNLCVCIPHRNSINN